MKTQQKQRVWQTSLLFTTISICIYLNKKKKQMHKSVLQNKKATWDYRWNCQPKQKPLLSERNKTEKIHQPKK